MPAPAYRRLRLTAAPDADTTDAVAGIVHDPIWFLARQWQVGEFQGENATTPVTATISFSSRPISHDALDPTVVPAEAIIESERDDWWTMGRRVRIGRKVAKAGKLPISPRPDDPPEDPDAPVWWFRDPPPPYSSFRGDPDGYALWAGDFGVPAELFAEVPGDIDPAWNETELVYAQTDAFQAPGDSFDIDRHRGGRVDWYSVDARPRADAAITPVQRRDVLPTRMTFPGMPLTGIWEIEVADADIGAVPPDSSHSSTAIMTELYFGHHDEWFDIPLRGAAGTVLRIDGLVVRDSFDNVYRSSPDPTGPLRPPLRSNLEPWTLFLTDGLDVEDLVLWHVAEAPLESDPLERVQFGIDEAANLLWAVERRADGRDMTARPVARPDGTVSLVPRTPPSDLATAKRYAYVPGEGAEPHWIPYQLDDAEDATRWEFVQRRLVDLSLDPPLPMPLPVASVLKGAAGVHRIAAASIPAGGVELVRRYKLARDSEGGPVLWIQRQRQSLLSPPGRMLRFDVAEPEDAPPT